MNAIAPLPTVRQVSIIDDDAGVRSMYSETVEDARLEPVEWVEHLDHSLDEECKRIASRSQAVLTDYNLRVRGYSVFNGAELAANLYRFRIPTVLCTKYDHTSSTEIRRYRERIPVLMNPGDLNDESLLQGLRLARQELEGAISPERKVWRTMIRIESVEKNTAGRECTAYLVIPAWDPKSVIEVDAKLLEPLKSEALTEGQRFHAKVNIGAENTQDIFIKEVEQP